MLKLYGFAVSNYYNIVKHYLLEKEIPFEAVTVAQSQEPALLAKSPMGKVPFIETERGILTETSVILDYLEACHPQPALYPADPFARARMQQIIKTIELYIEDPAHRMIGALFGREVPESVKESSTALLRRGLPALGRIASLSPYLCGSELTAADIFAFYALKLSETACRRVLDWDIIAEVPGLATMMEKVAERDVTKRVLADNIAALKAMSG